MYILGKTDCQISSTILNISLYCSSVNMPYIFNQDRWVGVCIINLFINNNNTFLIISQMFPLWHCQFHFSSELKYLYQLCFIFTWYQFFLFPSIELWTIMFFSNYSFLYKVKIFPNQVGYFCLSFFL